MEILINSICAISGIFIIASGLFIVICCYMQDNNKYNQRNNKKH
jgi:hypothetical protein